MRNDLPLIAFNRGIISPLALARTDLKAAMMAAEDQTNYIPRAFGSMMLRPGTEYIDTFTDMESDDSIALIPFVYDNDDTAIIEFFDNSGGGFDVQWRVRIDDSLINYPVVSSAITNPNFAGDLTGWTDNDDAGATSGVSTTWFVGQVDAYFESDNGYSYARRYQEVTVSAGDQNVEHAIKIRVMDGELTFSVGGAQGRDEYVPRTILTRGVHVFSFTPIGNFFIDLASNTKYRTFVNSVNLISGNVLDVFASNFTAGIKKLKYRQSADVVYMAFGSEQPYITNSGGYYSTYRGGGYNFKIYRYGSRSWGLMNYQPGNGPFKPYNKTGVTLTPSVASGAGSLTASSAFFKDAHDGALIAIDSAGQEVSTDIAAEDQYTNDIRVFGTNRAVSITLSGTWVATVTLQRSIGVTGTWVDVTAYTSNTTITYNDALDNQVIFYRIGVKAGDYTSGTVEAKLEYSDGSIQGICRVILVSDSTSCDMTVIKDFGGVDGTVNWREARWSGEHGFPSAVDIHDGRLWWAGKQYIDGSESDEYESFDDTIEGDSKPISRTIGYGPMDHINWMASLERLFLGTAASEIQAKASTFEAPLTESDFSLKDASTQGGANIPPVKIDNTLVYVSKTLNRIYRLFYNADSKNYTSYDLTALNPELLNEGVVKLAVQRQPDTRIHALLTDGTVAILMQDEIEQVAAWVKFETDGEVKDMVVLPGTEEDRVYYAISRTIDGTPAVYLEKWALESECQGGDLNKQADSFVIYDSTATTTPFTTELLHLTGETVVIWADGDYIGTDTVDGSGALTNALATAASKVVVGLPYVAQFKSAKLAYGSALGTALTKHKKIDELGLILRNTHCQGIEFGDDFTNMSKIPAADRDDPTDDNEIFEEYDADMMSVDTSWNTDSRLCLQSTAPKPCTILAAIVGIDTNG